MHKATRARDKTVTPVKRHRFWSIQVWRAVKCSRVLFTFLVAVCSCGRFVVDDQLVLLVLLLLTTECDVVRRDVVVDVRVEVHEQDVESIKDQQD